MRFELPCRIAVTSYGLDDVTEACSFTGVISGMRFLEDTAVLRFLTIHLGLMRNSFICMHCC